MERLKKCSGSLDSGFSINCPLRNSCERFKLKSIGFMQEFIKPRLQNEQCIDFVCCGNWDEEGQCKCRKHGR